MCIRDSPPTFAGHERHGGHGAVPFNSTGMWEVRESPALDPPLRLETPPPSCGPGIGGGREGEGGLGSAGAAGALSSTRESNARTASFQYAAGQECCF
eukprot:307370-Rhodomonas_salina.1